MKKTILTITIGTLLLGGFMTACKTSESNIDKAESKVISAEDNLDEAKKELNQARRDSIQLWKEETSKKINDNEKIILELKSKMSSQKKEIKADYEKAVTKLEQKNDEMKEKLDDFVDDGKSNWQLFKDEFNHDMIKLGKAFNDLTENNNKK